MSDTSDTSDTKGTRETHQPIATTADTLLETLRFDEHGLLPAIAQDVLDGEVRMVAYVNREAVLQTLATGAAHFYSRSRKSLWKKGESSGNVLRVRALFVDCDGDCVLMHVEPDGPSCHTGAPSCFFRAVQSDGALLDGTRPSMMTERLETALQARRSASGGSSYTRSLLDGGADAIGRKLREEADELARAIASESDERVASEAADVVFHLFVGLLHRNVSWRAVLKVLAKRFGVGGHTEKAARSKP